MKLRRHPLTTVLVIVSFIGGIIVGRVINDVPYLKLDPEINVLDLVTLIVTIVIAVMIPLAVTKIIDDKRAIKLFLIEEIKELISIIAKVRSTIVNAHDKNIFQASDRDTIYFP